MLANKANGNDHLQTPVELACDLVPVCPVCAMGAKSDPRTNASVPWF